MERIEKNYFHEKYLTRYPYSKVIQYDNGFTSKVFVLKTVGTRKRTSTANIYTNNKSISMLNIGKIATKNRGSDKVPIEA